MGTFQQRIEVAATREGPFVSVDMLVDTGATYTLLPRRISDELGVGPHQQEEFILADGRTVMREIAEVFVRLGGRVVTTLCIIGDDDDQPLLGAYTLEGFGLAADPVNRRLVTSRKYLAVTGNLTTPSSCP